MATRSSRRLERVTSRQQIFFEDAQLWLKGDTVDGVTYPGLDPSLNIYAEYSNEVWNPDFEDNHLNVRAAAAEVKSGAAPFNFGRWSINSGAGQPGDQPSTLRPLVFGSGVDPGSAYWTAYTIEMPMPAPDLVQDEPPANDQAP